MEGSCFHFKVTRVITNIYWVFMHQALCEVLYKHHPIPFSQEYSRTGTTVWMRKPSQERRRVISEATQPLMFGIRTQVFATQT